MFTPSPGTTTSDALRPNAERGRKRRMLGWLEDAGLILLLPFALGLAIVIVGAPLALIVWVVEVARRWL